MTTVRFTDAALIVTLEDGRAVETPLSMFPRLYHATPEQRQHYELSSDGIHWEALDEDISISGLLAGRGDMTHPRTRPHAPDAQYEHVKFLPYIGENYANSRYGVRVLVLGESHYGTEDDYAPDFTQNVIRDEAFKPGFRFFSMITTMLRGDTSWATEEERREAWQHVAFYNYVQEFVGDAGRIRPTTAMWRNSETALHEVVAELQPDVIVVMGYQLWDCLPPLPVTWARVKHPCGGLSNREAREAFDGAIAKALPSGRQCR